MGDHPRSPGWRRSAARRHNDRFGTQPKRHLAAGRPIITRGYLRVWVAPLVTRSIAAELKGGGNGWLACRTPAGEIFPAKPTVCASIRSQAAGK